MSPPNLSLILIMACFWLTFWIVQRLLIAPVGQLLEERRRRLADAAQKWQDSEREQLAAAEQLERSLEKAAQEAAGIRAAHRQRASDERAARLAAARQRADDRLRAALDSLDEDTTTARDELRGSARDLAAALTSRLLSREVRT